ncbi:MAG: hypothetical protein ABR941_03795 [Thermoleophilia bacterium]
MPAELASRIAAPLGPTALSVHDLAVLSRHVPTPRRRRRAQDFVVGHLVMADVGLGPLTLNQIDEALAGIALTDALCLLARMADDSDQAMGAAEKQVGLAFTYMPPQYALRAVRGCQESGARVFSAQLPLLLARRALNVCPDEGSSTWHDNSCLLLTCWLLGMLAIAIGEMVPAAHTDEDLVLDLARAQHFFRVMHDLEYEDAYDVLFVALPAAGTPVDLDEVVKARYGVTFRSLWAVTALMSLSYLKDREKARIVLDAVRPEVKQAWLDLWSMTPAQAAEDWAGDTSAAPWDLSRFFKHPVMDLGTAETGANVYLPIRSAFLAEKAILNEALWIVAELLPADQRQALLAAAGRAFEEVAQRRVKEFVGDPSRLLTEEQLKEWLGEPGGLCDLVVLYPDDWIAIEFVRHSLAKPTLTTGDYEDLRSDLEYGALGELRQIDGTVSKMLRSGTIADPQHIIPVVVVGGHLSINLLTYATVMAELEGRGVQTLTIDPRCCPPAFLDLGDLRLAMLAAEQLHVTLAEVLREYLGSELATMPFTFWLKDAHPIVAPQRAANTTFPEWLAAARQWAIGPNRPQVDDA